VTDITSGDEEISSAAVVGRTHTHTVRRERQGPGQDQQEVIDGSELKEWEASYPKVEDTAAATTSTSRTRVTMVQVKVVEPSKDRTALTAALATQSRRFRSREVYEEQWKEQKAIESTTSQGTSAEYVRRTGNPSDGEIQFRVNYTGQASATDMFGSCGYSANSTRGQATRTCRVCERVDQFVRVQTNRAMASRSSSFRGGDHKQQYRQEHGAHRRVNHATQESDRSVKGEYHIECEQSDPTIYMELSRWEVNTDESRLDRGRMIVDYVFFFLFSWS
jgi:hypothetical protein